MNQSMDQKGNKMSLILKAIETAIENHMANQPYRTVCGECGKGVDVEAKVDMDHDLTIVLAVCGCMKKE